MALYLTVSLCLSVIVSVFFSPCLSVSLCISVSPCLCLTSGLTNAVGVRGPRSLPLKIRVFGTGIDVFLAVFFVVVVLFLGLTQ